MLQKVQQNKWLRLGMGVCGAILLAVAVNLFIVPQGRCTRSCWRTAILSRR